MSGRQWLPTEYVVDDDGKVKILSYVNNLHPGALYPLPAQVFEPVLSLFERVLARLRDPAPLRIVLSPFSCNLRWCVDNTVSDAIVATALYFYDLEDVSDSKLAFRARLRPSFPAR
ncbi:hypothetical protein GGF31_006824 [Allomyces arbusculus]|nr:hypothetical protein GGF31_006824 [Allomyces arbusculus]